MEPCDRHDWQAVRIFRDGDTIYRDEYPNDWKPGQAVVTIVCLTCGHWTKRRLEKLPQD